MKIYAVTFRWGWPEDVWFHVDKVSSAHVYARLPAGQTIHDMSEALVEDCAQLVKANSIQVFTCLNILSFQLTTPSHFFSFLFRAIK